MYRRPNLYTSYERETQIFPTITKKVLIALALIVLLLMPFDLPVINQIPFIRFLGDSKWLRLVAQILVFIIAALGLNILSGLGGQVSLGHSFFMGAGACAAAVLGGQAAPDLWGWGLPIWIWLPGAGVVAGVLGAVVAPVAVRLRGLYLAIVTLGLVFVGLHLGTTSWGRKIAGAPEVGRPFQELDVRIWKEEEPLILMSQDSEWLWFEATDAMKRYWFLLVLAIIAGVVAKNLARTRTGRALQAIRDRDVAAEVMGVPETKYKFIAFTISSAYAGIAGALLVATSGQLLSNTFSLELAVEFIAILLIGGVGTVSGTIIGATVVVLLPRLLEEFTKWLGEAEGGLSGQISDFVLTSGEDGDFGVVSTGLQTQGWPMSIFDWNIALFGVLIVVFLIFEPLGFFGIWVRIRNYWKGWPFTY